MRTLFASGNNQFDLLRGFGKQSNIFSLLNNNEECEECILDWDCILYRQGEAEFCKWFFKRMNWQHAVQVFPNCQHVKISKVVSCGRTIYGLDQDSCTLYFVKIDQLLESEHPKSISKVEFGSKYQVKFNIDNETPKIIDISSSALECYAIDGDGGIYKVPNLLWRIEKVNFRQIHSGFGFHLLLNDTGAVYAFGYNSRGELGQRAITNNPDSKCEPPPLRIDFFDDLPSIVVSLACGGWHSLALTSDGDIYSWGWNESGQLGHSEDKISSITCPYPVDLGSADDPVVSIAAGARHSVAVLKSGRIFTWGFNKFGGLGLGDYKNRLLPTQVNLHHSASHDVFKVQCGRWTTLLSQ